MDKVGALFIFYICGGIGVILLGIGVGNIFSCGWGNLTAGIGSISLIPSGIWFNNNIERFLKD